MFYVTGYSLLFVLTSSRTFIEVKRTISIICLYFKGGIPDIHIEVSGYVLYFSSMRRQSNKSRFFIQNFHHFLRVAYYISAP